MAKYSIEDITLTNIADAIREKTGKTNSIQVSNMAGEITGIETQGVMQSKTVTPSTSIQTITADDGYDGLDTVTVNAIQTETKTVSPSISQQNVTPNNGKYLSQVIVNAIPTITQATPTISVNSSGLITATATQTAGYVTAGTKSGTHQLAFQSAKTITPTTASQIAVSSGYYTGGSITVAAIPSSYIIPSGTRTITENGTYDVKNYASATINIESSGGDTSIEDALVARTITTYTNDRVSSIGSYAFYSCTSLTSVSFPACTTIGNNAFYYCTSLTTVSFPVCTSIGGGAFGYRTGLTTVSFPSCTSIGDAAFQFCSKLTTVSFPACTTIGNYAFSSCTGLTSVSFPACTSIGIYAFRYCSSLSQIYLKASKVCSLGNSNVFSGAGIGSNKGSIYVPSSLVASYKAATNWTYFSNRIFSAP